jgi:hypothetical protein
LSQPSPVHTLPAGAQPDVPVIVPHMPSAAPAAFAQLPPQHSVSDEHASPFCAQNEGVPQKPFLQYFAQHSPLPVQGLPVVLHVVESGVHLPPSHLPPQHSSFALHAPLSAVHCLSEHLPPTHEKVQHSGETAHAVPGVLQADGPTWQTFLSGSHFDEQHSVSAAHVEPEGVQTRASPIAFGPPSAPPPPSSPVPGPASVVSSLPQPATVIAALRRMAINEPISSETRRICMTSSFSRLPIPIVSPVHRGCR